MEDALYLALNKALQMGSKYAEVRGHEGSHIYVSFENGRLREIETSSVKGIGVRVIYNDTWGFSSTSMLTNEFITKAVENAISIAKVSSYRSEKVRLREVKAFDAKAESVCKIDPFNVDLSEVIKLGIDANKSAMISDDIKNTLTSIGFQKSRRLFVSSDGAYVETAVVMSGLRHSSTAKYMDQLEVVGDSESKCAGYELIRSVDWLEFTGEISKLALLAVKAKHPPPGTYPVVLDSEMVGLLLHEAFGHASEADLVEKGDSVLRGRVGEKIASECVTIVDDGLVKGGYFVPFDDEGVRKARTVVVENGYLRTYISSRETAHRLNIEATGNARAEGYSYVPIVRQTNYYMEKGDYSLEELLEGIKYGFYVTSKGAGGGQVDTGIGSFTFRAGVSYLVENGEVKETVRGVAISGLILDTLKTVDAVGKDFKVITSVFGGCGKSGQTVRVGLGGPPIRVREMIVGGV